MQRLFEKLEQRLGIGRPIKVFPAGGMAVQLYTAKCVTCGVDAEFGAYVGGPSMLLLNLRDAIALARERESGRRDLAHLPCHSASFSSLIDAELMQ